MTDGPIHAGCIAIDGQGVLVLGASGSGKSDLMLRLIDRGAILVADDYCVLSGLDGQLVARAPAAIAGRIEVRGIGLVEMPTVEQVVVRLAIRLDEPVPRMPEPETISLVGIDVPLVRLPACEASAPIKAELALRSAPTSVD